MLFTNRTNESFEKEFKSKFQSSNKLVVASGYFGATTLKKLKKNILSISKKGECKILFGMVFHRGVTKAQNQILIELNAMLRQINPDNGIFISRKPYHGKIYHFSDDDNDHVYLGSSNFSEQGFKNRWECTVKIESPETKNQTIEYLNFLFSHKLTVNLSKVNLRRNKEITIIKPSKLLKDYQISENDYPKKAPIGECKIELRVDSQPASSLNLFFDKGRKNQNGNYEPRPWYEIEITSGKKDRENDYYPVSTPNLDNQGNEKKSRNGSFNAYINEDNKYYKIEMKVTSDYGKAIFSSKNSGGRETLGRYIKGKLEAYGALKRYDRITSGTLDAYGKNYIILRKIDDENYILEF